MGREGIEALSSLAGYFLDIDELQPGDAVIRNIDAIHGPGWLLFRNPSTILTAYRLEDVEPQLRIAEEHAAGGRYAAGFVSYEAAHAFDPHKMVRSDPEAPLLWFALYDRATPDQYRELAPAYEEPDLALGPSSITAEEYGKQFSRVKKALANGDSYQINLTFRQPFRLTSPPIRFFAARCGIDPPEFAAFLQTDKQAIASFSPELFFERTGAEIRCSPMKGTAPLHQTPDDLSKDPKSIAENVMIVDMVRNDLGSICEFGSVRVPELLAVRAQRGLWQMTSEVRGRTKAPLTELFRGLFPAASVTGAPKIASMRLINELEDTPRGIYCGAIGFMGPGYQRFSVAIRTAVIDQDGQGKFGIGSGIVWDSNQDAEYCESLAKRDLLLKSGRQWELVESISPRLNRLDQHLNRLQRSCERLSIQAPISQIKTSLKQTEEPKIRLAVQRTGSFQITIGPSQIGSARLTATLAKWPVASQDPNLRLKTNSREVYDRHLEATVCQEVLLYNERKQLTEFCRGNLVVRIGGRLYTPPPQAGCLEGVGLSNLLTEGTVRYQMLTLDDLESIQELFFINAVVGLIPVDLTSTSIL